MRRVLLVIALAFTLVSGEGWTEFKTKVNEFSEHCVNSTNVDDELVVKSMMGEFVDHPKFLDYTFCMAKEMEFMDEDGKFAEKNFLTHLLDYFKTMLNGCVVDAEKETGGEKRSFKFVKCLIAIIDNNLNMTEI
ncbi:PREDICTED: uncharacterized protein LOC108559452 [Nicrophorus vespilloides]|uniref:Uncharacterized protein LOC108559452 n=1 Tax=Nicrophorus vespilloides TaxID=110193 RepID=A0ABM1MCD6_NICVS|nr:PREDICTED: uncharacterized protein LOC108559452 [Nicrophorus vespilloides]